MRCLSPRRLEPLLRTAHELTVENDGIADTLTLTRGISRAEVIREICAHLELAAGGRTAFRKSHEPWARQGPRLF